jgi:hypothetical protein
MDNLFVILRKQPRLYYATPGTQSQGAQPQAQTHGVYARLAGQC